MYRDPRPGEIREYRRGGADGASGETFAVIALTPNVSGEGYGLIIAGCDDSGSDAAHDLLFNEALCDRLVAALELSPERPLPYFEALLAASRIEGAGSGVEIWAVRSYPRRS